MHNFENLMCREVIEIPTDTPLREDEAWQYIRDVVLGLEYRMPFFNLVEIIFFLPNQFSFLLFFSIELRVEHINRREFSNKFKALFDACCL